MRARRFIKGHHSLKASDGSLDAVVFYAQRDVLLFVLKPASSGGFETGGALSLTPRDLAV